jgi:aminopeptidase-like protein
MDKNILVVMSFLNGNEVGLLCYSMAEKIFPINRSITGNGVRKTLKIIQEEIPLELFELPSGTKVFDWEIPKEWNVVDAYIKNEYGDKIVDFSMNNLHLMGYSTPVNKVVKLQDLEKHLYSIEKNPEAIPYVTSYYRENWGFCLSHRQRMSLNDDLYHVYIDSSLENGSLTYGELIIPGKSEKEIFLSTYICHPSMANNEISGPCVLTYLTKWILSKPRKYTYRVVFAPETIGSLAYLSKNLKKMKQNIIAGFNFTCLGDERGYSYLPSRKGNSYADRVAKNVLYHTDKNYVNYSFLERGSDERQYCSPNVDLPFVGIMRSKYGEYPEYHTSLDNLDLITPKGLGESFDIYVKCINLIENNKKYMINCLGEPQLSKRGLYPSVSTNRTKEIVKNMMNFIAYADGTLDLVEISDIIDVPVWEIYSIIEDLTKNNLLHVIE